MVLCEPTSCRWQTRPHQATENRSPHPSPNGKGSHSVESSRAQSKQHQGRRRNHLLSSSIRPSDSPALQARPPSQRHPPVVPRARASRAGYPKHNTTPMNPDDQGLPYPPSLLQMRTLPAHNSGPHAGSTRAGPTEAPSTLCPHLVITRRLPGAPWAPTLTPSGPASYVLVHIPIDPSPLPPFGYDSRPPNHACTHIILSMRGNTPLLGRAYDSPSPLGAKTEG